MTKKGKEKERHIINNIFREKKNHSHKLNSQSVKPNDIFAAPTALPM